jgi:hypothetical protein
MFGDTLPSHERCRARYRLGDGGARRLWQSIVLAVLAAHFTAGRYRT